MLAVWLTVQDTEELGVSEIVVVEELVCVTLPLSEGLALCEADMLGVQLAELEPEGVVVSVLLSLSEGLTLCDSDPLDVRLTVPEVLVVSLEVEEPLKVLLAEFVGL